MKNYIKKNSKPILISILSVALFTSVVGAHDAFSDNRGKNNQIRNGIKAMKQLDLSEEQQSQLKELTSQRKEVAIEARSQRNQIQDLIESGDVNGAAEIAASQARERVSKMADKKMAIEAILTPEQLQQLSDLKAQRQAKIEERLQKRATRRAEKSETTNS